MATKNRFRTPKPTSGPVTGLGTSGDLPGSLALLSIAAGGLLFLNAMPAAAAAGEGFSAPSIDSIFVLRVGNQGEEFLSPCGVAIDTAHGEIVVANMGRSRIEFFDLRAYPLGWFVHRVPNERGSLVDGAPRHVAVDAEGNLLVTDLLVPWVDVVDYRGRPIARLTLPAPDDSLRRDHGAGPIGVAADGTILVASRSEQGRVHEFDREYRYLGTWGTPGTGPGQLASPTGIAVSPQGDVVVTCAQTHYAVQMFDAKGGYLRGFGVHDLGAGNFSLPSGVVVTADGRIWVSDAIRQVVQVFDPAGNLLGVMGGGGVKPGEFRNPNALASDGRGLLAVTEQMGARFQLLWVR